MTDGGANSCSTALAQENERDADVMQRLHSRVQMIARLAGKTQND